ncbi:MAG: ABC transporter ATP-binding protein [Syntrophaceae bacterium]|nr:ABC transporter ATP-binding protein [Syntrophaceae bacterium]
MVILEAKEIEVSYYGDISILQGVNLSAEVSKITAIIGPNGAGKSTLLKTLCGFLKPKKGKVFLRGREITGVQPHTLMSMGLSYIPQYNSLFPDLTVKENLELGAWTFRKDHKRIRDGIEKVFQRYPFLKEKASTKTTKLSGGQQRILELGRTLMGSPEVLLLDEITAMIAPIVAKEIYQDIENLSKEKITVVMVDQNVRQVIEISDYIFILELGKNKVSGTKEEFSGRLKDVIQDWLVYENV